MKFENRNIPKLSGSNMLKNTSNFIREIYYKQLSEFKSRTTYPESLDVDLSELLSKPRSIKVAVIDNEPFPWTDALESRGYEVTYYPDYTKPIKQAGQKLKPINPESADLILCDIHDVGSAVFPGLDGLGVIENLRKSLPLHVIAAYTGDPGSIYKKLKKQDTLDMVFSRDWLIEVFLLNLEELSRIFKNPKNRWIFIRRRLEHLNIGEKRIQEVQRAFVRNVLQSQLLKQNLNYSTQEIKRLTSESDNKISLAAFTNAGIKATEIASLLSPLILEATK